MSPERVVRPPWIRVTAGPAATSHKSAALPRRVVAKVIASALVVLAAFALVGVVASRRLAETGAVNEEAQTASLLADAVVQPAVSDALLTSDASAVAAMDRVVRENVLNQSIVRVKIWDPTGRILYSDKQVLIGQRFPLRSEEEDVLAHAHTRAEVSELTDPENRLERDRGKLLEVYKKISTPAGKPVLFEIYAPYEGVTARTGQLWTGFAGVALAGLLLLVVLMTPILWSLLNRLKRSQAQRETPGQRAGEASTEDLRRIAGALHDGVVQDLIGASIVVAAGAARATSLGQPELADEFRSASDTVRASIHGLRTLLMDIYPPGLARAGLTAALTDLVSTLRSRGTVVMLEVAPGLGLDSNGERLVFRVAQECLNNIAQHAAATNVQVRLHREERHAVMEITDNGVGFDAPDVLAHPVEGQFGLRVLCEVVADAGAELFLSAAPGAGTRWQLRTPLP
jgi:two-component system NarL family sensor kinase